MVFEGTDQSASLAIPAVSDSLLPDRDEWPIYARAGDTVMLLYRKTTTYCIKLQAGERFHTVNGNFSHDSMIGMPYGSIVSGTKGLSAAMLRRTPEHFTKTMSRLTQILYADDINLILMLLDVQPGKIILESGTGSCSLSVSLAQTLRPGGMLHTFEFHEGRHKAALSTFADNGLTDVVTAHHGDVCKGFDDIGFVHGIFLDLPMPWDALPHVSRCLVGGGRLCSFNPCIEQVERMSEALRQHGFHSIRMFETLPIQWGIQNPKKRKRFQNGDKQVVSNEDNMETPVHEPRTAEATLSCSEPVTSFQLPGHTHTGYLLIATKSLDDE